MARGERRGAAIITALFVGFMVLLFGLALGLLATVQMYNASGEVDRRQAYEAAQAGLAQVMDDIARNPQYGQNNETQTKVAVGPLGAAYSYTFSSSSTTVPWSSNNLQGTSSTAGYEGYVVPPATALVFVTGFGPLGNVSQQVAVVELEPYTLALAASGSVSVGGSMTVTGASSLSAAQSGTYDLTGDVYGGSSRISVSSGAASTVNGSVTAVGSVSLASGSTVSGGTLTGQTAQSLPNISVTSFDNSGEASVTQLAAGIYILPVTLSGPTYVNGDLTLLLGAVMNNCNLYVKGNLTVVLGETSGSGSMFVTGTTNLTASSTTSTTTTIALFSQGELTMTGSGRFQGLVYSNTGIQADGTLNVLGGVFVNGGNIDLDQSIDVVYLPQYLSFGRSWVSNSSNRADVLRLFWQEL